MADRHAVEELLRKMREERDRLLAHAEPPTEEQAEHGPNAR